jgi:folate-binding protein YgfZ
MPRTTPLHAEHATAGARLVEVDGWSIPADFGDAAAEYRVLRQDAGLLDLSFRGKLRLAGPDRAAFLHNMLTNDILALRPGRGCHAAKLTVQGKMQAALHVLCLEDAFLCDVEPGPSQELRAALTRHLVMENATLEDVTERWALLAVQGQQAARALARLGAELGALEEELQHAEANVAGIGVRVVRSDHCGEGGFDLWVPADSAARVWRELLAPGEMRPVGLKALDVRRIEAGIPWHGSEITPDYLPLEVGLEDGWISYSKGCYLGQETISRLHHLGHVNRHLRRLLPEGDVVPGPGTTLWGAEKRVGAVTSATFSPRLGAPLALGYVHRDFASPGTLLEMEEPSGRRRVRVHELR